MKKTSFLKKMAVLAVLLLAGRSYSQTATFINNLSCTVEVFIEVKSGIPGSCGPAGCTGKTVIIPPSGTTEDLAALCSSVGPYNDLCVFVTKVGSCTFNGKHLTASCHGSNTLDSSNMGSTCCGGAPGWTATWNPVTHTFTIS